MLRGFLTSLACLALCAGGLQAAVINVPGTQPTLTAAYAAANSGVDSILITDSGTYAVALVLNKDVNISAAAGQSPSIIPDGTANFLFVTTGTQTFKIGSTSGGRIQIKSENAGTFPLSRVIKMDAQGGTQTFENVTFDLKGAAAPTGLTIARGSVNLPGASTAALVIREAEVNCNSLVTTLFRPELLSGRTLTLDWVRFYDLAPGTGGWFLYNGGGSRAYGTINLNKCIIPTPPQGREGLLADGGSPAGLGITWNITDTIIVRKDSGQANWQTWRLRSPRDTVNAVRSVFINDSARAFDSIVGPTECRYTFDHCDLIANDLPVSLEDVTNSTVTLTHCNLLSNRAGSSTAPYIAGTNTGTVFLGGTNNVRNLDNTGSVSYDSDWPAGAQVGDIAVNPGYVNYAAYDFTPTEASVISNVIGSRLNVATTLPVELGSFTTE